MKKDNPYLTLILFFLCLLTIAAYGGIELYRAYEEPTEFATKCTKWGEPDYQYHSIGYIENGEVTHYVARDLNQLAIRIDVSNSDKWHCDPVNLEGI